MQDVLLDPKTGIIYTPNTNQTTKFGETLVNSVQSDIIKNERRDYIQDPETGKMMGSTSEGSGSAKADGNGAPDESSTSGRNETTNAVGQPVKIVNRIELTAEPNSVSQKEYAKGGIDRNYYGADGKQIKQIANNDHGKPKQHPYGTHGEHAHDYIYDKNGNLIDRPMRELTDEERKENSDIL